MREIKYKYIPQPRDTQEDNNLKAKELAIQGYNAEKLALGQMMLKGASVTIRLREIDNIIKNLLNTSIS